jgi:hypothetical protein
MKWKYEETIAALQARNQQLIRICTGALCRECADGKSVLVNSEGFYSHREEGNYCNAHKLHVALESAIPPDKAVNNG